MSQGWWLGRSWGLGGKCDGDSGQQKYKAGEVLPVCVFLWGVLAPAHRSRHCPESVQTLLKHTRAHTHTSKLTRYLWVGKSTWPQGPQKSEEMAV